MVKAAAVLMTMICLLGESAPVLADDAYYSPIPAFGLEVGASFPLNNLISPTGGLLERKQFLGKSVLINFYTVYCAPCIREVPKLNKIMSRRHDINFLAVTPDSESTATAYIKEYHLDWPIAAGAKSLLFDQLNVQAFPAFALLDADGRLLATVLANQLGGEDGNATVEGIEKWVDEQLLKNSETSRAR